MIKILLYILIGLMAGTISGSIGIGGGVIIVPLLVFLFGFSQHEAQGTTLALMVPPIGLLAAYTYFKAGHVDVKVAAFICLGFFAGGLVGSKLAVHLPQFVLQKVFAGIVIIIGVYLIFKK